MNEIDPGEIGQIEQRLREIWRRHVRIIISDSQEVDEVKERLEKILVTLDSYAKTGADASEIRLVARDLGTAQRQFAILGFVNIARVIERVEESLADLGTDNSSDRRPQAPKRFEPQPTATLDAANDTRTHEEALTQRPKASLIWLMVHTLYGAIIGWSVLRFLAGTLTVEPASPLMPIAVGGCFGLLIGVLYRFTPTTTTQAIVRLLILTLWLLTSCAALASLIFSPKQAVVEIRQEPEPTVTPQQVITTPTPIIRLVDEDPIEDISARVTDEIKRTEAALKKENLDQAIESFGAAVAIDRHHPLINKTAEKLIKLILEEADRAAGVGRWDRASRLVDDAFNLANYFYLETGAIEHTKIRHNSTARFVDTLPNDLKALNLAIGKRVKIMFIPSDSVKGTIRSVSPGDITLDVNSGVGGGQVRFTKSYRLNEIRNIRVYGEGLIDPPKETPTPTMAPRPPRRHRNLPQRRRRTPAPRRG